MHHVLFIEKSLKMRFTKFSIFFKTTTLIFFGCKLDLVCITCIVHLTSRNHNHNQDRHPTHAHLGKITANKVRTATTIVVDSSTLALSPLSSLYISCLCALAGILWFTDGVPGHDTCGCYLDRKLFFFSWCFFFSTSILLWSLPLHKDARTSYFASIRKL